MKFLGEAGNWVRENKDLYRDFHLLGGDPAKRQPYGYAHSDGKRCLLALRNPWIEPRTFVLPLDQSIGLHPSGDEKYVLTIMYPYRQTCQSPMSYGAKALIALQDYEVLLADVRLESLVPKAWPRDARWSVDAAGRIVRYDARESGKFEPSGSLRIEVQPGKLRMVGSVEVAAKARGQIQLMIKPDQGKPAVPLVRIDGKDSPCAFHLRTRGKGQCDAWALADVPGGHHAVEIELAGRGPITVGGWMIAAQSLTATATDTKPAHLERLFPVFACDELRGVATLVSPAKYVLPMQPAPTARGRSRTR